MDFTKKELIDFVDCQKKLFDIVRLVDPSLTTVYDINEFGELFPRSKDCYTVWKKSHRCHNCISAQVSPTRTQLTKFEFVDYNVFFVISLYANVDDVAYTLEMVKQITDETLFDTFGKNRFIDAIETHNKKIYSDSLTEAFNRRYYDEQICNLNKVNALVMIDIDGFKAINDTFGHHMGDLALVKIVKTIKRHIRPAYTLIRYGGDEFLLVFQTISPDMLGKRLEKIRADIESIVYKEEPQLHTTVSMGAVYSNSNAVDSFELADEAMYKAKLKKNNVVIQRAEKVKA